MKERGLMLNADMVRAYREDRKTNTRRPVRENLKALFDWLGGDINEKDALIGEIGISIVKNIERLNESTNRTYKYSGLLAYCAEYPEEGYAEVTCPYGLPGDIVYIREQMRVVDLRQINFGVTEIKVRYEADGQISDWIKYPERLKEMPIPGNCLSNGGFKEASRDRAVITNIRVERVQDISEQDAMGEIASTPIDSRYVVQQEFKPLWQSIYGTWDENPWVWVIEFKRIQPQQVGA